MSKRYKKKSGSLHLGRVVAYILLLAIVIVVIGVLSRFTNGFTEDVKTFYVSIGGEDLFAAESQRTLPRGKKLQVSAYYTFSMSANPEGYTVQVLSYATEETQFQYSVLGTQIKTYRSGMDLTGAFDIKCYDDYFTIEISQDMTIRNVLSKLHQGQEVLVPEDVPDNAPYYQLVITSHNGETVYKIVFDLEELVAKITLSEESICF